ncbi:MAG: serine protease [Planctomycetota bacterium]
MANVTPTAPPAIGPVPGSGSPQSMAVQASQTIISAAMAATVRLRVEDETGHSFGTGTVVDMHEHEALVLTCGHLFRESKGSGRIICDSFAPGARQQVHGTLISYDVRRDVGLISFEPGVQIPPARVGNVGDQPRTGAAVFAIGCNRGDPATVIQNRVLAVNRYHGPANLVVGGRPIDGRSGGGLFAADGTLIGVCNAADQQADEGVYAALGPIHTELDNAGLDFVYRTDRKPLSASATVPVPTQLVPPAAFTQTPAAPGAEVIYIWRDPNSEGERRVVVIDQPSQGLLANLNAELDRRGAHVPTDHHVTPASHGDEPAKATTVSGGAWESMRR